MDFLLDEGVLSFKNVNIGAVEDQIIWDTLDTIKPTEDPILKLLHHELEPVEPTDQGFPGEIAVLRQLYLVFKEHKGKPLSSIFPALKGTVGDRYTIGFKYYGSPKDYNITMAEALFSTLPLDESFDPIQNAVRLKQLSQQFNPDAKMVATLISSPKDDVDQPLAIPTYVQVRIRNTVENQTLLKSLSPQEVGTKEEKTDLAKEWWALCAHNYFRCMVRIAYSWNGFTSRFLSAVTRWNKTENGKLRPILLLTKKTLPFCYSPLTKLLAKKCPVVENDNRSAEQDNSSVEDEDEDNTALLDVGLFRDLASVAPETLNFRDLQALCKVLRVKSGRHAKKNDLLCLAQAALKEKRKESSKIPPTQTPHFETPHFDENSPFTAYQILEKSSGAKHAPPVESLTKYASHYSSIVYSRARAAYTKPDGPFPGLQNTGNRCYQNAVIQAMCYLPRFAPVAAAADTVVGQQLNKLFATLRQTREPVVVPEAFLTALYMDKNMSRFVPGPHHDVHEFLTYLLDSLFQVKHYLHLVLNISG